MDVAIIIQIPSALQSPGIQKKKKEEKNNEQDGMPHLITLRVTADRLQGVVPTTFIIKYKQLPAQLFLSPQEKYDMKCLGISLFLGGGISFLTLRFFHSPWWVFHSLPSVFFIPLGGYFIPCPLYFSFPALCIFHSLGGYFIPYPSLFHSPWWVFHSLTSTYHLL